MDRKKTYVLLLIVCLGFLMRMYGLGSSPPTSDDVSTAFSAVHYMEQGQLGPTMWYHPNLRNILVSVSMDLLGTGVWGVKGVTVLLGSLSVLLIGLVALRIFRNSEVALLAAFLLAVDIIHIYFSRQAVHEVYMAFFFLAGIYYAFRFLDRMKPRYLIVSGIVFGLGLASKWYVVFPLVLTYMYIMYEFMKRPALSIREKGSAIVFLSCSLVILPSIIYMLTFIPWFGRGYGLSEWFSLQHAMYTEAITHTGYHPYGMEIDHKAYLWFVKPVAFGDLSLAGIKPTVYIGLSNPFVWLLALPSMIYLVYKGYREKTQEYLFLVGIFCATYIPLLLSTRPLWVHTAFSVLPYTLMATAYALFDSLKNRKKKTVLILSYLFFVILFSVPLYLLATGKGLEFDLFKPVIEHYRPSHERELMR